MKTLSKAVCVAAVATTLAGASFANTTQPVNEVPTQGLLGAGGLAASGTAIVGVLAAVTLIASQDNKPATTTGD